MDVRLNFGFFPFFSVFCFQVNILFFCTYSHFRRYHAGRKNKVELDKLSDEEDSLDETHRDKFPEGYQNINHLILI